MKRTLLIGAALAALFIVGCTTNETRKAEADAQVSLGNARVAEANAAAEQAKAEARFADKVDAGGASAYLLAKALKGIGFGQAAPQQVVQAPQSLFGLAWQSALQLADLAIRGYGIKAQRDVGIVQSNNQAATAIASYGAFSTMGQSIATAGIAGYPYVQAPAANVTNTYTLSGTGVLGSGTYTGPVNTNRNCTGGSGAAGGNGTTTSGGAGGSASGGNC